MSENTPTKRKSSSIELIPYEEKTFQTFCRQMLQTRVFKGYYQERRYVQLLNEYRDLIVIDKKETDLIKDLMYIRNRIQNFYENQNETNQITTRFNANSWIGITFPEMIGAPAAGVCIWTEIENIPFGEHRFYMNTVQFRDNEFIIKIKQVLQSNTINTINNSANNTNNINNGMNLSGNNNNNNNGNDDNDINIDFIELLKSWKNSIKQTIFNFLNNDVNRENIISTLKFLALVIISLTLFMIEAIKYIGFYGLKFMIEIRLWVHTLTPIILKLIEMMTKVIGGIFILIAMLWRDFFNKGNTNRTTEVIKHKMLTAGPSQYQRQYLSGRDYYRNLHYSNNNRR